MSSPSSGGSAAKTNPRRQSATPAAAAADRQVVGAEAPPQAAPDSQGSPEEPGYEVLDVSDEFSMTQLAWDLDNAIESELKLKKTPGDDSKYLRDLKDERQVVSRLVGKRFAKVRRAAHHMPRRAPTARRLSHRSRCPACGLPDPC